MKFDVIVIGAGTAGAASAAFCAREGLRVLCVDAAPLERAGARWLNGVPRWCFDEAGIDRPRGQELRGEGEPFHVVAGWGPTRIIVKSEELQEVDMRGLVSRLQDLAWDRGAMLRGRTRVRELEVLDDRVQVRVGGELMEAPVRVDASGLGGLGLAPTPRPDRVDLCTAAQQVRRVRDVPAARAWFRDNGAEPGDTLCFTGVAGGYSIVNVRLHRDELSILTGSIPALGYPSGVRLLERFVEQQSWAGEKIFGGARAIPLRLPYTRLDYGPIALIGDSACQVFSMHGSGVGAQLVAARHLARALAEGRGPWGYNVDWQRKRGGHMAASYLFACFSRSMNVDELAQAMDSGLLQPHLAAPGLEQRPVRPSPLDMPALARATARAPDLVSRIVPVLARMGVAQALYLSYPRDPTQLPTWRRGLEKILQAGVTAARTRNL